MPGPPPRPVAVSPPQRALLLALVRGSTTPQGVARRAQVVLAAADGARNEAVARTLGCTATFVRTWRARWAAAEARLAAAEAAAPADLRAAITAVLADRPRPGAPPAFTPEQVVQIIALACEPPPTTSHRTPRQLADEAIRRGVVPAISPRTVGRFLGSGPAQAAPQPLLADPRPRRSRGVRRPGAAGV